MPLTRAYVALGSNQGERLRLMQLALDSLSSHELSVVQVSPIYENRALGMAEAEDFLNAIAEVDTSLSPINLLDRCLLVESELGRIRGKEWAPRTIDLDIITYGHEVIQHPRLCIPHPRLAERDFVVHPLNALAPDLVICGQRVSDMAQSLPTDELTPTDYCLHF